MSVFAFARFDLDLVSFKLVLFYFALNSLILKLGSADFTPLVSLPDMLVLILESFNLTKLSKETASDIFMDDFAYEDEFID